MAGVIPEGIRLGIVRGISYGLFGKPDTFMPQLRELGATLVRIYGSTSGSAITSPAMSA